MFNRFSGIIPAALQAYQYIAGQTLVSVISDLQFFINHPYINSISTYLLIPGAAPKLLADIKSQKIPPQPTPTEQALFRLHSYATLLRNGWVRKGTNSYMDPKRIPEETLSIVAGKESIGAQKYEDFLIGAGPQANLYCPGARIENTVNANVWMDAVEKGIHSFSLPKCSLDHQKDMTLWGFPLVAKGLHVSDYEMMLSKEILDQEQIKNFNDFIDEGLIIKEREWYQLSIVSEVFMGHLVRNLKKKNDRSVIDNYIKEGFFLGELLAKDKISNTNSINNRQIFKDFFEM